MVVLEQRPAREQAPVAMPHFHHWQAANGDPVAWFYRIPGGFMLRFPNRGDFTIALEERIISCTPTPEVSETMISAVYFNQVLPLLASYDGELVLHASAAVGPRGALAFVGQSGSGKSTLAAGFARAGHPFLTDDGLWLEQVGKHYLAKPNRPGLRLWPDSEAAIVNGGATQDSDDWCEKGHFVSGPTLPFQDRALSLQAIYLLGEGLSDTAAIARISPLKAASELNRYTFILDIEDRTRHRAHFERLVQFVKTVDCFTLDYPRKYEALPDVITAILEHAN